MRAKQADSQMTLTLDWGDFDETFVIWSFAGRWTPEEFYTAMEKLRDYGASKPYPVKIMVDMRHSLAAPNNLLTLLRAAVKMNVRNIGQVVVITPSNFWPQMYEMLVKTVKLDGSTPVTFVKTVDDAYSQIGVYAEAE